MSEKNIGILGMGVTGVAAAGRLKESARLYLFDEKKTKEDLLKQFPHAKVLTPADLDSLDYVVKSPGIPPHNKMVRRIVRKGIPIYSDLELFYQLYHPKICAVTGTNGKTTVTSAIYEILKDFGAETAGNIGRGIFDVTPEEGKLLIVECSSFQLHDIHQFHPRVAVITNVTEDHLDWHGTIGDYRRSKANIVKNLEKDDVLVLNIDDPGIVELKRPPCIVEEVSLGQRVARGIEVIDGIITRVLPGERIPLGNREDFILPGDHNIMNLCQALLAGIHLGMDLREGYRRITTFHGVAHRLEYVDTLEGVQYFNDSKGTNPDSTDVALRAMDRPVILLAGGYDKKSDYRRMFFRNKGKIKALILMGDTAKTMGASAREMGIGEIFYVNSMKEGVEKSATLAEEGDSVLLSPACASWGMYQNYEERGEDFVNCVRERKVRS